MCFKENEKIAEGMFGNMLSTTAIAAIKEKRHFIGMELNKEYFDIACERVNKEQKESESSLLNKLT